ncbi:MAG TPA: hypothetical protein PK581_08425, partial [Caldisericia bacterium]|nr:hypothetical protein [Caldisericia bacterium]
PNQQGTEDYSYDNMGRLQNITYPDNSIMEFTWTARDKVATLQYTTSQNVVHSYVLTYDNENNLKTSVYSIDGLQQASWSYIWGPQGLEYANKNSGALTQNFTTDPRGRILSMTYTSATYSGELYFHYDVLGNTSLITDANSNPKASFQYDLHTGRLIQSWNPSNLEIINLEDGIIGSINITASTVMGKDIIIPRKTPMIIGGTTSAGDWGSIHIGNNNIIVYASNTITGKDCGDMVGWCDHSRCEILFNGDTLKHDYDASAYNCSLIFCCASLYMTSIEDSKGKEVVEIPNDGNPNDSASPKQPPAILTRDSAIKRRDALQDWFTKNATDCQKFYPPGTFL